MRSLCNNLFNCDIKNLIYKLKQYIKTWWCLVCTKIAEFNLMLLVFISLFIQGCLMYLLFYLVPLNIEIPTLFFYIEECTFNILIGISGCLNNWLILTLCMPLYYFYYREQKNISSSYTELNKFKIKTAIKFMFILFSLIYLQCLSYSLDKAFADNVGDLIYMKSYDKYLLRFAIGIILGTVVMHLILKTIKSVFLSLNVSWLLEKSINESRRILDTLYYFKNNNSFKSVCDKQYEQLLVIIESIYQMLNYTIEKNMDVIYELRIEDYEEIKNFLQQKSTFYNEKKYMVLLKKSPEKFLDLYQYILKSHSHLVIKLYNKNKYLEGKKALKYILS